MKILPIIIISITAMGFVLLLSFTNTVSKTETAKSTIQTATNISEEISVEQLNRRFSGCKAHR